MQGGVVEQLCEPRQLVPCVKNMLILDHQRIWWGPREEIKIQSQVQSRAQFPGTGKVWYGGDRMVRIDLQLVTWLVGAI